MRGQHAGHQIGDRDADPKRRTVRIASDAHQAALGLHDRVVAGLESPRPRLSEAGDRRVNQLWPRVLERRVVEAEARERPGPEVLDDDIGLVEEAIDDRAAPRAA